MKAVIEVLLFLLNVVITTTDRIHNKTEYCQSTVFRGTCRRNEVIVMTSAEYGRMHIGKCVVANMGYLGCKSDVLPLLHTACSGRTQCEYPVPNTELDRTKPCFQEVKTFLEVSYKCVKVAMAEKTVCSSSRQLKLMSGSGYLSSYMATHYECGTLSSPWRILVSPGQTLHISLVQFSCQPGQEETLGFITERATGKNHTLSNSNCTDPQQQPKEQQILSVQQSADVQILSQHQHHKPNLFLLKYTVSGCQDLVAPRFAWYRRDGEHAVVGCEHSETTWHLKCDGSTWIGVIGNCLPAAAAVGAKPNTRSLPTASTIVIILCIALAIALAVLGCGFWTVFRHHLQKKSPHGPKTMDVSPGHRTVLTSCPDTQYCQQKYTTSTPPKLLPSSRADSEGRDIWGGEDGGAVTPGDSDYGSQSYSSMRHTAPYSTPLAPSYIVATQQQSNTPAAVLNAQNCAVAEKAGERCVLIGPVH